MSPANLLRGSITYDGVSDLSLPGNPHRSSLPSILIDNIVCTGSERNVLDCEHGGRGSHNCYSGEFFRLTCEARDANTNITAAGILKTTGTLEVGQTLTADVSDITDENDLPEQSTFSYQWVRVNTRLATNDNEEDISNATSSTYDLQDVDSVKVLSLN